MADTFPPDVRDCSGPENPDPAALVTGLREMLGAVLTAYLAGAADTGTVRRWAEGAESLPEEAEGRLRLAYRAASIISGSDAAPGMQTWFQGLNPRLGDQSPARLIREAGPDHSGGDILDAACAFART